jgi:exodeoxyribonuclease V alpha subunit
MTVAPTPPVDPFAADRLIGAGGLFEAFNEAGVVTAGDLQLARRLVGLSVAPDESLVLAVALAIRALRLGHVLVDLSTVADTVAVDVDEPLDIVHLPWPDTTAWLAELADSPIVAVGDDETTHCPLRLIGSSLYLDRYWREEGQVAADLAALRDTPPAGVREDVLDDGLRRLFGDDATGPPGRAGRAAVTCRLTVVAGGPGTGKTTSVVRIAALLAEQRAPQQSLVALVAPTGKAAARLQEAVRAEAVGLDVAPAISDWLAQLEASTLHRLLGRRPDHPGRFRHHRGRQLPHDAVIVDEASMVSLTLMARLLEALRPEARLILVGDPNQLTSVEAGAVLGDIVAAGVGDGVVVLEQVHRYGGSIAELAAAVRDGDADATIAVLARAPEGVTWIAADGEVADAATLAPVIDPAVAAGERILAAARAGDAEEALTALGTFRVLCAHRRGPHGVSVWQREVEGWLASELDADGARFYIGRPLMVTENDYELRLFNGDTGVVVATPDGLPRAAFRRGDDIVLVPPARLGAVDTVYAMTIHKSQGSQFAAAAVVLPAPSSRILTRELLYTAVTRAREQLIVVGTEEAIRSAVTRRATRATGLRDRLRDA